MTNMLKQKVWFYEYRSWNDDKIYREKSLVEVVKKISINNSDSKSKQCKKYLYYIFKLICSYGFIFIVICNLF